MLLTRALPAGALAALAAWLCGCGGHRDQPLDGPPWRSWIADEAALEKPLFGGGCYSFESTEGTLELDGAGRGRWLTCSGSVEAGAHAQRDAGGALRLELSIGRMTMVALPRSEQPGRATFYLPDLGVLVIERRGVRHDKTIEDGER